MTNKSNVQKPIDIFIPSPNPELNVCINLVGKGAQWGWYTDGFKLAARILAEGANTFYERNVLVYPIGSLSRHSVEMKLKEIILDAGGKLTNTHKLEPLWAECKAVIRERGLPVTLDKLNKVEELITSFDFDKPGTAFRYPFAADGTQSLPRAKSHINLQQVIANLEETHNLLDEIASLVEVHEEEKREWERELEREFGSDVYVDY